MQHISGTNPVCGALFHVKHPTIHFAIADEFHVKHCCKARQYLL